ncbi:uncharacterized protein N7477_006722 [Penicillium maclennaniae]|uniref:uncharacterized protein n=1 Tax=Penicillium maclennaniae TaxID=1343394 RepID=UPI0025403C17|nr:uncharacterized protein N7477_006722 [Penicillium maclennaniae]KAJ5668152.1 hypothetical protein N7477_006722 [Penicillium maclennaniae]
MLLTDRLSTDRPWNGLRVRCRHGSGVAKNGAVPDRRQRSPDLRRRVLEIKLNFSLCAHLPSTPINVQFYIHNGRSPPEQVLPNRSNPFSFTEAAGSSSRKESDDSKAPLPKGVVLDKDGKPKDTNNPYQLPHLHLRRSLEEPNQASQIRQLPINQHQHHTYSAPRRPRNSLPKYEPPPNAPPDVEELGRSTWTLLHSMAATYPETANAEHQDNMRGFLKFFSKLYPCWVCADDFRTWMAHPSGRNQPKLGGRKDFGWWLCEAHNEVNRKLGKKEFDCRFWEERWRTGWKDGRCD